MTQLAWPKVAKAFPDLPLVVYHGYWPNVQQAIGLAFLHENVHLVPDVSFSSLETRVCAGSQ